MQHQGGVPVSPARAARIAVAAVCAEYRMRQYCYFFFCTTTANKNGARMGSMHNDLLCMKPGPLKRLLTKLKTMAIPVRYFFRLKDKSASLRWRRNKWVGLVDLVNGRHNRHGARFQERGQRIAAACPEERGFVLHVHQVVLIAVKIEPGQQVHFTGKRGFEQPRVIVDAAPFAERDDQAYFHASMLSFLFMAMARESSSTWRESRVMTMLICTEKRSRKMMSSSVTRVRWCIWSMRAVVIKTAGNRPNRPVHTPTPSHIREYFSISARRRTSSTMKSRKAMPMHPKMIRNSVSTTGPSSHRGFS